MIICGGRDFDDYELFQNCMDRLLTYYEEIRLVSGHASGADRFAERYAAERGIEIEVFPAEWKKYGRAAGPIRNREMLDYAKEAIPEIAAFWDGKSKGTKDMLKRAQDAGVKIHIFNTYQQEFPHPL